MNRLSRRRFLAASALGAVAGAGAVAWPRLRRRARESPPGRIAGGAAALGHILRDASIPPASTHSERAAVVIVGGGAAGFAAARRLEARGIRDVLILELESASGGASLSGENAVSRFPWGAHYVPLASEEAVEVTRLFEEFGIIRGRDAAGAAIYEEEYLCADLHERLFLHGRWQEGLVPQAGVSIQDQAVLDAFFAEMDRLRATRGDDGRRPFVIPVDASSQDPRWLALDRITMADYLAQRGWMKCAPLRWYVDYCCRDDYGAGIHAVSAWAGLHYFASRHARAANAPGSAVLTWPEGNGWLMDRLRAPFADRVRVSHLVWNVIPELPGGGARVDVFDSRTHRGLSIRCEAVVWAAPWFVARHVLEPLRSRARTNDEPVYSPWMVANLTVPLEGVSDPGWPAWDNVLHHGNSLGYVVATHQSLQRVHTETVLTYYQPLDDRAPAEARAWAQPRTHGAWCAEILDELRAPHPRLGGMVRELNVWIWGHGMVRPVPGYLWGAFRRHLAAPLGAVHFAHSDTCGVGIFEEAYTRGCQVGEAVAARLNGSISHA